MNFNQLHRQQSPLLICNVWDAESAKIAQALDYQAIGTSSGAIATMLGYRDGEEISFEELVYIVGRMTQSTSIPLTVDLEGGYSRRPAQIVEHIKRLADLGVVGINIEDSLVDGERTILDTDAFAQTLEEVCSALARQNQQVFINVRTDTFLLNLPDALPNTLQRARRYADAGAQGLFVPCLEKEEDIRAVVQGINLPLNIMCMPNLPDFNTLAQLGVKRISMGNFVYHKVSDLLKSEFSRILQNHSFHQLFA